MSFPVKALPRLSQPFLHAEQAARPVAVGVRLFQSKVGFFAVPFVLFLTPFPSCPAKRQDRYQDP